MLKRKQLRLPSGRIVAEQGLERFAGHVIAAHDEAYVVIQRPDLSHWYAAWLPYANRWDEVELDAEDGYVTELLPAATPLRAQAR